MIGAMFGFDGVDGVELTCKEYEQEWRALNGADRGARDNGALHVHSSYTDPGGEQITAWGLADEPWPRLGERVQVGVECRHWRFRWPAGSEPGCAGD